MDERVLAWEGNVDADAGLDENVAVCMEAVQRFLNVIESITGDRVLPDEITEVHKSCNTLDHFPRNMASDCCEVNLVGMSSESVRGG
jgi:hypothetical protein